MIHEKSALHVVLSIDQVDRKRFVTRFVTRNRVYP